MDLEQPVEPLGRQGARQGQDPIHAVGGGQGRHEMGNERLEHGLQGWSEHLGNLPSKASDGSETT